jgi:hypothetical protein
MFPAQFVLMSYDPATMALLDHQEYVMELVIVSLSIGTLILLATHMIDYAVESTLRSSSNQLMPEDEAHDVPLPFEGAAQ